LAFVGMSPVMKICWTMLTRVSQLSLKGVSSSSSDVEEEEELGYTSLYQVLKCSAFVQDGHVALPLCSLCMALSISSSEGTLLSTCAGATCVGMGSSGGSCG
jgi:hypothetical protein